MSVFLNECGLTADEIVELQSIAMKSIDTSRAVLSRRNLECVSPETTDRIRNALVKDWMTIFSETGRYRLVGSVRDDPGMIQSLHGFLTNILVDPLMHRSVVSWCFYHALRESSESFQLDHCTSPTGESHLTGLLLGEIKNKCCLWGEIAATPLDRAQTNLSLKRIDLSILGGEQKTGGDFALVLDFHQKGLNVQSELSDFRIVPLVFQAKRYLRPSADLSQKHRTRGYQSTLLCRNPCRSAYIFYENGTHRIEIPMQPLLKSVTDVSVPPYRTNVLEGGIDLPSYLLKALCSPSFAVEAESEEEALRMILGSGHSAQLSTLAVISSTSDAEERYSSALVKAFHEDQNRRDKRAKES